MLVTVSLQEVLIRRATVTYVCLCSADTPTGTPVGSEEDLAPRYTPPASKKSTRQDLQVHGEEMSRVQDRRDRKESDLSRKGSNEFGNRGPLPDVTIPQGESSNFGMSTRRSVHMSSVRVKASEGSVMF